MIRLCEIRKGQARLALLPQMMLLPWPVQVLVECALASALSDVYAPCPIWVVKRQSVNEAVEGKAGAIYLPLFFVFSDFNYFRKFLIIRIEL